MYFEEIVDFYRNDKGYGFLRIVLLFFFFYKRLLVMIEYFFCGWYYYYFFFLLEMIGFNFKLFEVF